MAEIVGWDIIRNRNRPNMQYYIEHLFSDFIELSGDRFFSDDLSVICGIATFEGTPVTIIGQQKGRFLEECVRYNFSMSKPEGYRKVLRHMKQAEKFGRPVLCFIDTPGAYPGREAEERGQGNAIANCLMEAMYLQTPIISIFLGEGGSGGALALGIADYTFSLEHAVFSVISPKACAEIIWKDIGKEYEAMAMLKMKSSDLQEEGFIDKVIFEPGSGAHTDPEKMSNVIKDEIKEQLDKLLKCPIRKLLKKRGKKYRKVGNKFLVNT